MGERGRRDKASDVFGKSELVFSKKGAFGEAFPQIKDLTIEVRQTGKFRFGREQTRVYTKEHFPGEFVDCGNPLCYGGGFSVWNLLREMVGDRVVEKEATARCQGHEGSPKGRRKYRDCLNFFTVRAQITYTEATEADSA